MALQVSIHKCLLKGANGVPVVFGILNRSCFEHRTTAVDSKNLGIACLLGWLPNICIFLQIKISNFIACHQWYTWSTGMDTGWIPDIQNQIGNEELLTLFKNKILFSAVLLVIDKFNDFSSHCILQRHFCLRIITSSSFRASTDPLLWITCHSKTVTGIVSYCFHVFIYKWFLASPCCREKY